MSSGGFNPLKPPMPPGVNSFGAPKGAPNPMGHNALDPLHMFGGGAPQSAQNVKPAFTPGAHFGHVGSDPMTNNPSYGTAPPQGGMGGMSSAGPLQNALMGLQQRTNIAPGGSMAQFQGAPQFMNNTQGGALTQGWGAGGGGTGGGMQQLPAQMTTGPMGLNAASLFAPPGQLADTYMHGPRGTPRGNQ